MRVQSLYWLCRKMAADLPGLSVATDLPSAVAAADIITCATMSTEPTLRGAWVLKNLFGDPPAPPPPTIDAIEPDIRGATTVREQLALHRSHESCNRCHRAIDPAHFERIARYVCQFIPTAKA